MAEFTIIPVLGRKVNVAQDDLSLFKGVGTNLFMTHDVGGVNFDLERVTNSCSKAKGRIKWSSTANATATRCLGLYELWDGTNRNHIYVDAGNIYYIGADLTFTEIADSGATTFASDEGDLYSFIRIGDYVVFADRGEHTPYKWKHGDANLSKLIASGTEYKFRFLNSFQRRVIGCYSDQSDGEIDVRWSTSWPGTAIASLNFPAANQLYIPNDDPISGTANLGTENCFVYCEDSINQIVYVADYASPFRIYTIVPDQGCAGHHSIINMGNRHFFFNRHYGFCEYRGGGEFPYGGRPISENIESDLGSINADAYRYIVGTKVLLTNELAWTVPIGGATNNAIFYYNYRTGEWRKEDKSVRYIDSWRLYSSYTWTTMVRLGPRLLELGAAALSMGSPRGSLSSAGSLVGGRIHGPGLYPAALDLVWAAARIGIPVLGAGGVFSAASIRSMLESGAIAVQVDAVLWLPGANKKSLVD